MGMQLYRATARVRTLCAVCNTAGPEKASSDPAIVYSTTVLALFQVLDIEGWLLRHHHCHFVVALLLLTSYCLVTSALDNAVNTARICC
jgi:hypothetical protein